MPHFSLSYILTGTKWTKIDQAAIHAINIATSAQAFLHILHTLKNIPSSEG